MVDFHQKVDGAMRLSLVMYNRALWSIYGIQNANDMFINDFFCIQHQSYC